MGLGNHDGRRIHRTRPGGSADRLRDRSGAQTLGHLKEYDKVGYEFKAAAHALESAAGRAGAEAKTGAAAAVADTKTLGDKLASSSTWTREEVAKSFESLGNAINALGQKIGSSKKAAPVNVGS